MIKSWRDQVHVVNCLFCTIISDDSFVYGSNAHMRLLCLLDFLDFFLFILGTNLIHLCLWLYNCIISYPSYRFIYFYLYILFSPSWIHLQQNCLCSVSDLGFHSLQQLLIFFQHSLQNFCMSSVVVFYSIFCCWIPILYWLFFKNRVWRTRQTCQKIYPQKDEGTEKETLHRYIFFSVFFFYVKRTSIELLR